MSTLATSLCLILLLPLAMRGTALPPPAPSSQRWIRLADTLFEHVAQDADLPNAAIPTAFSEDGTGFLWVGTQNGLARWDGYSFRVYKMEAGVPGTLPDNYVTTLHTDPQGRLWVGTSSGGLARYDDRQDLFVAYPAESNALSHAGVVAITDDGTGGLWIATQNALDHLDVLSGRMTSLFHHDAAIGGTPAERILALLCDRRGVLWIGTSKGLVRSDGKAERFTPVRLTALQEEEPGVESLLEDTAGRIWIGTGRHGAYLISAQGGAAQAVKETAAAEYAIETEQIHAMAEVHGREIWLGTYGQGIVAVDAATLQTRRIVHDPRLPNSLRNDNIWAMYQDRGGLIWVGTDRSISRHDPQMAISTISGASSRADSIADESVHFVLPMPNGLVWLGLGSHGVDVLDPGGVRVNQLRPDSIHPARSLPKSYVDAALLTPGGDVYLGTPHGFYRTSQTLHGVSRIALPEADQSAEIWSLLREGNTLWIGGPDGLAQLDLAAGPTARVRLNADRLSDRRVDVIVKGPPGQLWIGTENGLDRIDLASHGVERVVEHGVERVVERIMADPRNPTALLSGFINSVLTDRQGRLWVGTMGGICVLLSRDADGRPRFRRLGAAEGLPNGNVDTLLEDGSGNIWASTDNGIAVIDPRTFAVRALGRPAGVAFSSYWVNSGAVTAEGEVLFGAIGGLTVVRPGLLTNAVYHPPVVVTGIRIGSKPVTSSGFNDQTSTSILEVPPDANSVLVEFAALDYSAPERCHYAYRLEGYDRNWIDTDATHRQAVYTNLPPGNYLLRIRGSNRDGVWTARSVTLAIHVLPSWYQTTWSKLAALFLVLTVVILFVQGRTSQLRQRQRKLEQSVAERTAELEDSQRQLERFAYFDVLTGLPNRRMFYNDFAKLLGQMRRRGGRFTLVLIDLDAFKQVNDTYGHDAGDALLVEVGVRLRRALRDSDSVARLGGDEFAILLMDDHDPQAVAQVCQRITHSFAASIPFKGAHLKASLCFGVAMFPDHGRTMDGLYKTADVALYEAKRAGASTSRPALMSAPQPDFGPDSAVHLDRTTVSQAMVPEAGSLV